MVDIIQFDHVSFTYPEASAPALVDINLTIERSSFVAVLGANGCGKSTLAKHTNAIVTPTSGHVFIDGMDTADETHLIDIRRRVGMVFQNPDNQIVANVVEDDVAFAPENLGVDPAEIRARVDGALKSVGMYELRQHSPSLLSGGQKQRVAIAGVLAMQPEALVLDEPTAMLDPKGRREVLSTIEALRRETGMTVLLITHHMGEAAQADRVIVMDKGTIAMDGAPREIFPQTEKLRSLGLDVPETTALLQALNRGGLELPDDITDPDACAQAIMEALCRS